MHIKQTNMKNINEQICIDWRSNHFAEKNTFTRVKWNHFMRYCGKVTFLKGLFFKWWMLYRLYIVFWNENIQLVNSRTLLVTLFSMAPTKHTSINPQNKLPSLCRAFCPQMADEILSTITHQSLRPCTDTFSCLFVRFPEPWIYIAHTVFINI